MTHPTKAVHSWALHRTLGSFVAAGAMPMGGLPAGGGGGLALLDLPAELARRGYGAFQLAHFYLPSTDPALPGGSEIGPVRGERAAGVLPGR